MSWAGLTFGVARLANNAAIVTAGLVVVKPLSRFDRGYHVRLGEDRLPAGSVKCINVEL